MFGRSTGVKSGAQPVLRSPDASPTLSARSDSLDSQHYRSTANSRSASPDISQLFLGSSGNTVSSSATMVAQSFTMSDFRPLSPKHSHSCDGGSASQTTFTQRNADGSSLSNNTLLTGVSSPYQPVSVLQVELFKLQAMESMRLARLEELQIHSELQQIQLRKMETQLLIERSSNVTNTVMSAADLSGPARPTVSIRATTDAFASPSAGQSSPLGQFVADSAFGHGSLFHDNEDASAAGVRSVHYRHNANGSIGSNRDFLNAPYLSPPRVPSKSAKSAVDEPVQSEHRPLYFVSNPPTQGTQRSFVHKDIGMCLGTRPHEYAHMLKDVDDVVHIRMQANVRNIAYMTLMQPSDQRALLMLLEPDERTAHGITSVVAPSRRSLEAFSNDMWYSLMNKLNVEHGPMDVDMIVTLMQAEKMPKNASFDLAAYDVHFSQFCNVSRAYSVVLESKTDKYLFNTFVKCVVPQTLITEYTSAASAEDEYNIEKLDLFIREKHRVNCQDILKGLKAGLVPRESKPAKDTHQRTHDRSTHSKVVALEGLRALVAIPPSFARGSCLNCGESSFERYHPYTHCTEKCTACQLNIDGHVGRGCPAAKAKFAPMSHKFSEDKAAERKVIPDLPPILSGPAIIDGGASPTYLTHPSQFDAGTLSYYSDNSDRPFVTDATGGETPLLGHGEFFRQPALLTDFPVALISHATFLNNKQALLYTEHNLSCIHLNSDVQTAVDSLISVAQDTDALAFQLPSSAEGLYPVDIRYLRDVEQHASSLSLDASQADAWTQSEHRVHALHAYTASAAFYQSASFPQLKDEVRFWHETFNHCDAETLINISTDVHFKNFPKHLTPKVIRKHFPVCLSCPVGNMSASSHPHVSQTEYRVGQCIEIDIYHPPRGPDGKRYKSFSGGFCALLALDVASDMTIPIILNSEKNLLPHLVSVVTEARSHGHTVEILRMDAQFQTVPIIAWAKRECITLQSPPPYEHSANGHVERRNRYYEETLIKVFHAQKHLDQRFWALCYVDVCNKDSIRTRPDGRNPYFLWHKTEFDLNRTATVPFGLICLAHIPTEVQQGFGGKALETIVIGQSFGTDQCLLLFNEHTKRMIIRRAFKIFSERPFSPTYSTLISYESPFTSDDDSRGLPQFTDDHVPTLIDLPSIVVPTVDVVDVVTADMESSVYDVLDDDAECVTPNISDDDTSHSDDDQRVPKQVHSSRQLPTPSAKVSSKPSSGRKSRMPNPMRQRTSVTPIGPKDKKKSATAGVAADPDVYRRPTLTIPPPSFLPTHEYTTRQSTKLTYKNSALKACMSLSRNSSTMSSCTTILPFQLHETSPELVYDPPVLIDRMRLDDRRHTAFTALSGPARARVANMVASYTPVATRTGMLTFNDIPLSYRKAKVSQHWPDYLIALSTEFQSMRDNDVFKHVLVDKSTIDPKRIVPSKLIFDTRFNPDGTFKKYKCRLVARGDVLARNRIYDPDDNYAGTVKSESVRLILNLVASKDLCIRSVDVVTAFLKPTLRPDDPIYMRRPPELSEEFMPEIVELNKAIYGLPAASAYFRDHSDNVLKGIGFTPTVSDPCVYIRRTGDEYIIAIVHVDDFGFAATSDELIDDVQAKLSESYDLTINPNMTYYLGLHIVRNRAQRTITIRQPAYIDDMIKTFGLEHGPDVLYPETPMSTTHIPQDSPLLDSAGKQLFMQGVGTLLYLAVQSRPDILFSTTAMSRKCQSPTIADARAVSHIMNYIVGTRELALTLRGEDGIVLYATVDASYGTHTDSKSHSGCTVHLGINSGSFLTLSKKQTITADSSTYAEFIAAHLVTKQIMWVRNFLSELGFPLLSPTTVYEDNQSTIRLINNRGNGNRTKHIALRYNFVREQVELGNVTFEYLPTARMPSDSLTKATGPTLFLQHRVAILGLPVELI